MPPKKRRKRSKKAANSQSSSVLSLQGMPESFFSHVFSYLGDIGAWPTIHALRVTCKAFNNLTFSSPPQCENLIIHFCGGDGLLDLTHTLFNDKMCDHTDWLTMRGDSLAYLADIIQAEVCRALKKVHAVSNYRSKLLDVYPPEVNADDFCLVGEMSKIDGVISTKESLPSYDYFTQELPQNPRLRYCENLHQSGFQEEGRLIRALGFRCGTVKMNDDVLPLVWEDMMRILNAVITEVVPLVDCQIVGGFRNPQSLWSDDLDDWRRAEYYQELKSKNPMEDFRIHFPPPTQNGIYQVVPGFIKHAAVKLKIQPIITGYQQLGCDGWATTRGRTREDEIKEAINCYKVPSANGEEDSAASIEDCLVLGSDDEDFEEDSGSEESADSDHELDDTFLEE